MVAQNGHGRAYKSRDVVKLVDTLRLKIRKRARNAGGLRDPFNFFAAKRRSFGIGELSSGLRDLLDTKVARADVEDIFEHMDLNRDGKVRYNEFLIFVEDEFFGEVEQRVRSMIMRQAQRWDGDFDLRAVFEKFDRDDSGRVSKKEFSRGLAKLGLDLSEVEARRLVNRFDVDGDGQLDYQDFVEFAEDGRKRHDSTSAIVPKFRKEMQHLAEGRDGSVDPWRVFRELDRSRSGRVNKQDFERGMEKMGLGLSSREVRQLFDCFDFDGDGEIRFNEFEDFVVDGGDTARRSSGRGGGVGSSSSRSSRRSSGRGRRGSVEMDEDIRDILEHLQELIQDAADRGIDYRESFEHFDQDYNGEVSRREFDKGLRKLKFRVSADDVDRLMGKFGTENGTMRYRDFMNMVLPRKDSEMDDVSKRLQKLIRERARDGGSFDIHRPFRHFDRGDKGHITRMEFKRGMEDIGFDVTDSECRMLIDRFDADGDGKISYAEFIDFADGDARPVSPTRKSRIGGGSGGDDLDDIVDELRGLVKKAKRRGVDIHESFQHFDEGRVGEVSEADLREGLRDLNFRPSSTQIDQLMERFAGRRSNRMNYLDFLDMVAPDDARRSRDHGRSKDRDRMRDSDRDHDRYSRESRDRGNGRDDREQENLSFVGLPSKKGFKPSEVAVVTISQLRLAPEVRKDPIVRKVRRVGREH